MLFTFQMCVIEDDTHLYYKPKHLINTCVKCLRSVDSSLKNKHIKSFVKDIINNYYSWNNFHNFKHAFEVFQMSWYLQQFNKELNKEDRKLLLIAALCHDLNHIGSSNLKLKNIDSFKSRLSCDTNTEKYENNYSSRKSIDMKQNVDLLYNDLLRNRADSYDSNFEISSKYSFNEEVHIKQSLKLLSKHLKYLLKVKTLSDVDDVNTKINTMIMATDLNLHEQYLNVINTQHQNNHLVQMILILKLADVSHPLRPFPIHCYWVFKLVEENNGAFDESLSYIAKDTIRFISVFVKPLLLNLNEKYHVPESNVLLKNLNDNIDIWSGYV